MIRPGRDRQVVSYDSKPDSRAHVSFMYIRKNIVNQSHSCFRYPDRSVNPGIKTKVQQHTQEIIAVIICSIIEKIDVEVSK